MLKTLVTFASLVGCTLTLQASTIQIFYTQNASPDVFSSTYSTTSNTLGTSTPIGMNPTGADGIIIGPNNTLIFGDETGGGGVFQIPQIGGAATFGSGTANSFVVAENQNNPNTVFDFNNAGQIATLPITGGVIQNGTLHTVTGADTNVSDLFWSAPTGSAPNGVAYYLTGTTGQTGDLGTINLSTYVTTQIAANIPTAQDAVFDPFSGLVILFGDGQVNTFNPTTNTLGTAVTLPGATAGLTCGGGSTGQLDLGTVDGAGHAYVAGCGNLYYIDYSSTGNILSLSDVRQSVAVGGGIKDVAVLAAATPEPTAFTLIGIGLIGFAFKKRRK